jgi:hypothetical protein
MGVLYGNETLSAAELALQNQFEQNRRHISHHIFLGLPVFNHAAQGGNQER